VLITSTLEITPEILGLIARIDEFKGTWRALGTLAPERLSALRRVATIESIGSSTRIEGSCLTSIRTFGAWHHEKCHRAHGFASRVMSP
jgi:hypothetical protein